MNTYNADGSGALVLAYSMPEDVADVVDAASVRTSLEGIANDLSGVMAGKVATTGSFDPSVVQRVSFRPFGYSATHWDYTSLGRLRQQSTTGGVYCHFELELPHGAALTGVSIYIDPAGSHAGVPSSKPKLSVYKEIITSAAQTQLGSTATDGSLSVGAYEPVHGFSVAFAAETVNRETTRYFARFEGESGTNALTGLDIIGLLTTVAVTARDVGAA